MQELNKNNILNDLFDLRANGLETIILKENTANNLQDFSRVEKELINLIKQCELRKDIKNQIIDKLEKIDNIMNEEMYLLNRNFYKIGFVDGITLSTEITKELEIFKK